MKTEILLSDRGGKAVKELDTEGPPESAAPPKVPVVSAACAYCYFEPSGKCSKCGGPWLYSLLYKIAWGYYEHNFNCGPGQAPR